MAFLDSLIYSNRLDYRISRHVLFWTVDCISVLIVLAADHDLTTNIVLGRVFIVPLTASVTYFVIYFLLPGYSRNGNIAVLTFGLLLSFLFLAYGTRYVRFQIIYPMLGSEVVLSPDRWSFLKVFRDAFRWIPGVFLAVAIKTIKNRSELSQRNQELITEKNASELAFLKAQMHPHFLFNTLNTLYADLISGAKKSESIVLRLANLMRFTLEESSHREVRLEKEVSVIEDYIQLEKLRHGDRLHIDYQSDIQNHGVMISPLLLLPFVENSFKHTLSANVGDVNITVQITESLGNIRLFVENDVHQAPVSFSNGTGINNVTRQLELLYGKNYSLRVNRSESKYQVNLEIPSLN